VTEVSLNLTEVFLTLTEVFRCFFLSCKANARAKLAKNGAGPALHHISYICVVRLLFVLFYVLFVCKCVLPPGDKPIAVNKYIKLHTAFRQSIKELFLIFRRHIVTVSNAYNLCTTPNCTLSRLHTYIR